MSRELLLAGVLISISTALKIFSVVALCKAPMHFEEVEHRLHHAAPRKSQQISRLWI
jgi:hypothetical protein